MTRLSLNAAVALLLAAGNAAAHDTWFAPAPDGALALSTGNRFPLAEQAVDPRYFTRAGCRTSDGTALTLQALQLTERATLLKPERAASSCFMQLSPFEIELAPDKVLQYFKEIRPAAEARAAWAALHARGLPFVERYTKSARVEGAFSDGLPNDLALDARRDPGELAAGDEAVFQVLRDGVPLADFNVELVHERAPLGLWQRTDAEGRLRARLPLAGRWLLRGTELRLAAADATRWESRFLAYSFEVALRQAGR